MTSRLVLETPCKHKAYGPCPEGDFAPGCPGGVRTTLNPDILRWMSSRIFGLSRGTVNRLLDALTEETTQ